MRYGGAPYGLYMAVGLVVPFAGETAVVVQASTAAVHLGLARVAQL